MHKRILFFFLFLSSSLLGIERGNPLSPSFLVEGLIFQEGIISTRMGYGQTVIWDERVKNDVRNETFLLRSPRIQGNSQDGCVILNIRERVDVVVQGGMLFLHPSFFVGSVFHELNTKQTPYFSVGGIASLIESPSFTIGVSGHAFFYYSHIVDWFENKHPTTRTGMRFSIKQWQVTPAISTRISLFSPYLGVCCRFFQAKIKNLSPPLPSSLRLKGRHEAGMVFGSSIIAKKALFLNLEISWIHERSLSFGGQLRF